MDERIAGQLTLLSFYRRYVIAETLTLYHFGRAQSGTFEHKIGFFVRFCPPKPSFSGFSSTKSAFLCVFAFRNPHFRAFRAQNRGFCALLPAETPVFGLPAHKIGVFVLGWNYGCRKIVSLCVIAKAIT